MAVHHTRTGADNLYTVGNSGYLPGFYEQMRDEF
jgi:hypothetical protein